MPLIVDRTVVCPGHSALKSLGNFLLVRNVFIRTVAKHFLLTWCSVVSGTCLHLEAQSLCLDVNQAKTIFPDCVHTPHLW